MPCCKRMDFETELGAGLYIPSSSAVLTCSHIHGTRRRHEQSLFPRGAPLGPWPAISTTLRMYGRPQLLAAARSSQGRRGAHATAPRPETLIRGIDRHRPHGHTNDQLSICEGGIKSMSLENQPTRPPLRQRSGTCVCLFLCVCVYMVLDGCQNGGPES